MDSIPSVYATETAWETDQACNKPKILQKRFSHLLVPLYYFKILFQLVLNLAV